MDPDTPVPAFVGREAELAWLTEHWRAARAGRGGVCFVTGEPGAGKSALVQAFARQLRENEPGTQVVDGDCNPQTGTVDSFLPFREILAELTGTEEEPGAAVGAPPERRRRWLDVTRNILQEHGPDLVDIFVPGGAIITRLGAQAAGHLRRHEGRDGDTAGLEQRHLLEQYTNVIRTLSEDRPLVLIVDDLHWADEASITLLFHLARRLDDRRVLLLGAYRATDVADGRDGNPHPLAPILNELRRYRGDITLDLAEAQEQRGRAFIDQLLDAEPNGLDDAFRAALLRHTGGHALFTVETLRYLQEQGTLRRDADGRWQATEGLAWQGLPARVDGVIRERVDRLEPDQRELLDAASVLGEQFHAEALAFLLDRPARDVRQALSGPLARRHQLVSAGRMERIDGLRLARYDFRHNLIHRYLYEALDDIERCGLHEDAAVALETLTDGKADALAGHLARHFDLAELPERAAPHYLAAAQRARRSLAQDEARRLYQDTLRCAEPGSTTDRDARYALAELDCLGGAYADARTAFGMLLDHPAADAPLWQAQLLRQVATTHEREHQHDDALAHLGRAEALLTASGEPPMAPEALEEWLTIQVSRLWLHYWRGEVEKMAQVVATAEAPLEAHGRVDQQRRFYSGIVGFHNRRDGLLPGPETLAASERARAVARASGRLYDEADTSFGSGFIALLAGDLDTAESEFDECLEKAQRCGDRTLEARCRTYRVMLRRMQHDDEGLGEELDGAGELVKALEMMEYVAVHEACRAWLAWSGGKGETARGRAEKALSLWAERAPRFPLKWLARLPLLALDLAEDRIDDALSQARELRADGQARLGNGISEALDDLLALSPDADASTLKAGFADVIERAQAFGYL